MMARKSFVPPPRKEPARLSAGDIHAGITKLKRRIAELESFDPSTVTPDDTRPRAIVDKIDAMLVEVFGADSLDFNRYHIDSLDDGGISYFGASRSQRERVDDYQRGKDKALGKLNTALSILQEKLADFGLSGQSGTPKSLHGIDLHPAIEAASGTLFRDGHYANAVENACKALNALVQAKSGIYATDGTELMRHVFSSKKPRLAFNSLSDETDRSEQEGMMHLYEEIFLAFRNPRAHRLVDDDAETAFGTIVTISFLGRMLDKTRICS
jgi:uncharacterized protein (TIGR02391 family)